MIASECNGPFASRQVLAIAMAPLSLVSAAVSAATPVVDRLSEQLTEGFSFAAALSERIADAVSDDEASGAGTVRDVSGEPLDSSTAAWTNAHRLAQKSLHDFLIKYYRLAAESDIDGSQPIRLKSDGQGGVHVDGGHPDRTKIEQLFESSPDLAADFHRLAAAQTTAVQLRHTAERLRGEFRLVVQPGDVEVLFE